MSYDPVPYDFSALGWVVATFLMGALLIAAAGAAWYFLRKRDH